MAVANKTTKIEHILLSEIEIVPNWNVRFAFAGEGGPDGMNEPGGGSTHGAGVDGLAESISQKGQDTAVWVCPNDPKKGFPASKGKPWFLVCGFGRAKAIGDIAAKANNAAPTIRAEIRNYDQDEAREANVRENTARNGISGADLVYGIGQLLKQDPNRTSVHLAAMLGMNQSYVNQLKNICTDLKDKRLLEKWRTSAQKITLKEMCAVADTKLSKEEQHKLYEELSRPKDPDAAPDKGRNSLEGAIKEAARIGGILGVLARDGKLKILDPDFFDGNIRTLVTFNKKADEAGVARVAGSAGAAYEVALKSPPEAAETLEKKEEKKNGAKDAAQAAS